MGNATEFKIKNVVKFYNKSKVLDIAEMQMSGGQFVALMGKNGSGKSTIMRLLAQQELFDSGDILLNGTSLTNITLKLNSNTVFISEDHELPFAEPLTKWLDIHQKIYSGFDLSVFKRLSKDLEIDSSKPFHGMSRGQKMKALFCLQAPKKPSIYLLDEITSVLDAGSRWVLMEFLSEEIKRGCLVLMSTNIASEMHGFATNVVFLNQGVIEFESECAFLGNHFKKIMSGKELDEGVARQLSARKINFNSDRTWTYMHPKRNVSEFKEFTEDQREITIADIQSYFTSGKYDE